MSHYSLLSKFIHVTQLNKGNKVKNCTNHVIFIPSIIETAEYMHYIFNHFMHFPRFILYDNVVGNSYKKCT